MPLAYPDVGGRRDYPPEPPIRDTETWLDWQAHQLDMGQTRCHWDLGRIAPGTANLWPQPTITSIRGAGSNSAEAQETHGATPSLFGPPPRGEI